MMKFERYTKTDEMKSKADEMKWLKTPGVTGVEREALIAKLAAILEKEFENAVRYGDIHKQ